VRAQNYSANPRISFWDRTTCTIPEATDATGISRSKIFELIADGRLQSLKIDKRRLVYVPSLRRLTSPLEA